MKEGSIYFLHTAHRSILFALLLVSYIIHCVALPMEQPYKQQHLILIGGGHSHIQVVKSLNKFKRPKYVDVTLIDMQHSAVYSGMVPGCVAGLYDFEETLIKLEPLAKWSGIRFIQAMVTEVNPDTCTVTLNDGQKLNYSVLSIDIGSASNGSKRLRDLAIETIIPTRPIASLVERIGKMSYNELDQLDSNIVVVGGGIAGIELSMAIQSRLKGKVTIIDSKSDILLDESHECREAVKKQLSQRGICVLSGSRVEDISSDSVTLQNGQTIFHAHCIWATGAEAHLLASSLSNKGVSCTPDTNWIRVSPTMQTLSHENIFASGDCCTIEGLSDSRGSPPKAGVYAVRAGPILIENISILLRLYAHSESTKDLTYQMKIYDPQDDFLKLIVCGDGTALGFRFGRAFYGSWVWKLKDYIDKKFMDLFDEQYLPDCSKEENVAHKDCSNCDGSGDYDTSQYDAGLPLYHLNQITPAKAASLLRNTDDSLPPDLAWSILRNMTIHPYYRTEVLREYEISE